MRKQQSPESSSSSPQTATTNPPDANELRRPVTPPPPRSREQVAIDEANLVLEALGGNVHLDGFNLLGVIANPRGSAVYNTTTSSDFYGRYNEGTNTAASASTTTQHTPPSTGDVLTDTYYSFEMTLSSVTEQMEALNSVLEDWSRSILEGDAHDANDESQPPESMLTELPQELQNLELQQVQSYLEASGVAAHSFYQRKCEEQQQRQSSLSLDNISTTSAASMEPSLLKSQSSMAMTDAEAADAMALAVTEQVEKEIPSRFFQLDFDLTDPETFCELLLVQEEEEDDKDTVTNESNKDGTMRESSSSNNDNKNGKKILSTTALSSSSISDTAIDTDGPVHEWFPLPPPDAFGSYLDKVELALLQQVRSKSAAFFEESLRFAQLQEMIQSLQSQVTTLQSTTQHLQQDLLDPMTIVPTCDDQRVDLVNLLTVLDRTQDMIQCKSSVGGFLSAQDDLTAIEQIQYGRRLLSGEPPSGSDETTETLQRVELRRLHALKSVSDQLNQYELLVVTNLREELVEIFLGWNTAAVTSIYAVNTNGATPNKSSQQVKSRVREIVGALQKCQALAKTRDTYGTRLQEVIRMTVRTTVGEFATDGDDTGTRATPISSGATAMSLDRFLDCLDMLFEQLLSMLTSAKGVDGFCVEERFHFRDGEDGENQVPANAEEESRVTNGPMASVVASAAELSSKSISELLRLRKEAHSLVSLEEMKRIWDKCMSFTTQIEEMSGHRATALRSTLLAQAKAFVERKHESNMSALVAALDSERWTQCEVSAERQSALSRLCSGRTLAGPPTPKNSDSASSGVKKPEAEVEGKSYKVVWSCLLLIEMLISNLSAATYFPGLTSSIVSKEAELLRLFNSRTTQLVLGAGAIHSTARLKSINAKHLSLVTQCLGIVSAILPHVRAGLMTQMPAKQHTLLSILDQIKKEFADHNEKVLNKFVTIIGSIVEHGLAPKIRGTNFDERSKIPPSADGKVACCIFLEGVSTNTRKMHQVLSSLLPPDHLQNVFSRIFAYVDQKVPALFIAASKEASAGPASANKVQSPARTPTANNKAASLPPFVFPKTEDGKRRMLLEVELMTQNLNGLDGVHPWDFTVTSVLGKEMEYQLHANAENGDATDETPSNVPEEAAEIAVPVSSADSADTADASNDAKPEQESVPKPPEKEAETPEAATEGPVEEDVAVEEGGTTATPEEQADNNGGAPTETVESTDEQPPDESVDATTKDSAAEDAPADQPSEESKEES